MILKDSLRGASLDCFTWMSYDTELQFFFDHPLLNSLFQSVVPLISLLVSNLVSTSLSSHPLFLHIKLVNLLNYVLMSTNGTF